MLSSNNNIEGGKSTRQRIINPSDSVVSYKLINKPIVVTFNTYLSIGKPSENIVNKQMSQN